jgi:hypothetical protein
MKSMHVNAQLGYPWHTFRLTFLWIKDKEYEADQSSVCSFKNWKLVELYFHTTYKGKVPVHTMKAYRRNKL